MNKPKFKGKSVDTNMSKEELLEVITYLSIEMLNYRQQVYDNQDVINDKEIKVLGLTRTKAKSL